MTDIPQDIWDAADKAHYLGYLSKDSRIQVDHIAKAILAERHRCAEIAMVASCVENGSVRSILEDISQSILKGDEE